MNQQQRRHSKKLHDLKNTLEFDGAVQKIALSVSLLLEKQGVTTFERF